MITHEELLKLSKLCKIKIDEESDKFESQINSVLEYVEKINNYKFLEKKLEDDCTDKKLRVDEAVPSENANLTSQFSDSKDNLLKVKKVL